MKTKGLVKIEGLKKHVQYVFGNIDFFTVDKILNDVENIYFSNKLGLIDNKSKELNELTEIILDYTIVKNDLKKKLDYLIEEIYKQYLKDKRYIISDINIENIENKKNAYKVEVLK